MSCIVRPLSPTDHDKWQKLFAEYLRFYRASIPPEIVSLTWDRIHDPDSSVNGLGAELDGELVGFSHFLFHDTTWSDKRTCYLEDLYVERAARGGDAARELILGVQAAAKSHDAKGVYWHTQQYNSSARSLYDTVTSPSSFIVYQLDV